MSRRKIFLTGATGVMGRQGLTRLLKHPERYEVTVLARKTPKNERLLNPLTEKGESQGPLKVIWGDLRDAAKVEQGVAESDIVLHVGGMVSPLADWYPEETMEVNLKAMRNIIAAALGQSRAPKVVYIGSVAQYGHRDVPNHWGRAGDLLLPAYYDAYAYSKTEAERLLAESGLPFWVSLRQTGILHPGLLTNASDPISFHVPIKGVLEWVTDEDSGRLLERVCREDVPESFWNHFYNIGGGAPYRLTNYEFESKLLKALGCPGPEKLFEARWFATGNFHGFWFADSDYLESLLHFRSGITPDEYFRKMKEELPWYFNLAPLAPVFLIKMVMKRVAHTPKLGPMWWIKEGKTGRIEAAFGSLEAWEKIKGWNSINLRRPADTPPPRKHKPDYSEAGIQKIIARREGRWHKEESSTPETLEEGIFYKPDSGLRLECCRGHRFELRARTLVEGGHWCPECMRRRARIGES